MNLKLHPKVFFNQFAKKKEKSVISGIKKNDGSVIQLIRMK